MIAKDYWKSFYKTHTFDEPSGFAQYVVDNLKGTLVDLGCGDGRDTGYFLRNRVRAYGVDAAHEDVLIIKQDVDQFMKENDSPDNVYTRFFWHSIDDETRQNILKWTKKNLFIEARTTKDKPQFLYGKHDINLVDTKELKKDLESHGFTIDYFHEGYGMSKFFSEDPHLVRVIAHK